MAYVDGFGPHEERPMIKVSVMYPSGDDATFDMDYYKTKHMEIVDRTMKPARWEIDSGVDGPYIAIGNLYFDSMEAMQAGMGGAGEALADIPNFTNTESAVQVSQIVDS
jgi:uncharacterized protein (TIGR02118 family)